MLLGGTNFKASVYQGWPMRFVRQIFSQIGKSRNLKAREISKAQMSWIPNSRLASVGWIACWQEYHPAFNVGHWLLCILDDLYEVKCGEEVAGGSGK